MELERSGIYDRVGEQIEKREERETRLRTGDTGRRAELPLAAELFRNVLPSGQKGMKEDES